MIGYLGSDDHSRKPDDRIATLLSGRRLTNLPHHLTSFIGREQEAREIEHLVPDCRLLTLTGAGGIGKTRLALHVASQLLPRFKDGVWIVDLALVTREPRIPQTIALALGVHKQPQQPHLTTLGDSLGDKHMLLILDNCDHLVAACASIAFYLLQACPKLFILTTSREPLNIRGEQIWSVSSLSVPPANTLDVKCGMQFEAVKLFIERARSVDARFRLTRHNMPAIVRICRRLDGIPLAIELAAERMRVLSAEQIAARLEHSFELLTGGNRLALPRQQTLKATLDWSYELLSQEDRMLLQYLSVFVGAWTLEAAEEICQPQNPSGETQSRIEVLEGVTHLVNKSLLIMEEADEQIYYRFLETIRQYGLEKLEATGQKEHMQGRHLNYYLSLVQRAKPHLYQQEQVVWLQRLEREFANVQIAFEWAMEKELWKQGIQLVVGLYPFWTLRDQYGEGYEWLEQVIHQVEHIGSTPLQPELFALSVYSSTLDPLSIRRHIEESLRIYRRLENHYGIAVALMFLAGNTLSHKNFHGAFAQFEESAALFRQMGDRWGEIWAIHGLARVAFKQGDLQQAHHLLIENIRIRARLQGERILVAKTLNLLGRLTRYKGDYEQEEQLYEEALRYCQEVGNGNMVAVVSCNLAQVVRIRGDFQRAFLLARETLVILCRSGRSASIHSYEWIYLVLICLAGIVLALRKPEQAAQIFGTAETISRHGWPYLDQIDRDQYEQDLAILQSQLEKEVFEKAWEEGRQLNPGHIIALAQGLQFTEQLSPTSLPASPSLAHLTKREEEVLRLLAQGLTNKQIAKELVLSPKTVNVHVISIFKKINVSSRSAATRFALEHTISKRDT